MKVTHENNIEVYRFRNVSDTHSWADIYIDVDVNGDNGGALLIRSDFGSWDYYWRSCGEPFKKFLTGLEKSYLFGKLCGAEKEFRMEEWLVDARRIIEDHFENESPSHPERLTTIEELESLGCEHNFQSSETIYAFMGSEYANLLSIFQSSDTYPKGDFIPRQLEMFVEQVWPSFVEELNKELVTI